MSDTRISVIIPVYNGERYLAEAIRSVLEQTLPPDEIIVVDDGSTDGSARVVAQMAGQSRLPIRYVHQVNQGPSAARNRGVRSTDADLIAFLDADDIWDLRKQEIQAAHLFANPAVFIVWGFIQMFAVEGTTLVPLHTPWHGPNLGSALFRREVFESVGDFDETMRLSEDLDWYLRARELEIPQSVLTDVVLWYRRHEENMWLGQDRSLRSSLLAVKKRLDRRRALNVEDKNR